jgi:hypothetical protein
VYREPNRWERAKPEDEEGCVVSRGRAGTLGKGIRYRVSILSEELFSFGASFRTGIDYEAYPAEPDGPDHQVHAVPTNVRLDTVPDTRCFDQQMGSLGHRTRHPLVSFHSPIAARLKTGQRLPHIPKDDRLTTGNPMWYMAPMRPVRQMKQPAMAYPIQTHNHDCHQDRPLTIMAELIIQVLMLKESAIQKPTKFHGPHWRRAGSTGLRS